MVEKERDKEVSDDEEDEKKEDEDEEKKVQIVVLIDNKFTIGWLLSSRSGHNKLFAWTQAAWKKGTYMYWNFCFGSNTCINLSTNWIVIRIANCQDCIWNSFPLLSVKLFSNVALKILIIILWNK